MVQGALGCLRVEKMLRKVAKTAGIGAKGSYGSRMGVGVGLR